MFAMTVAYQGVVERVLVAEDESTLLDKVIRWEPDVRLERVFWQSFGYKKGVLIRGGLRTYEIFQVETALELETFSCDLCGMPCHEDDGIILAIGLARDAEFCDEAPSRLGGTFPGFHQRPKA